jgi:hypothetical protein
MFLVDSCHAFEEHQKIFVEQKGLQVLAQQLETVFPPIPHKTFLAVISLTHVFTLYERMQFLTIAYFHFQYHENLWEFM